MINKWTMKETNLMKCSLEKWGRAPIILGGASTHLFECSSTHYFKRARAPIIQEGTSTHFQRQLSREQVNKCKVDMREISSWNAVLKKWGRAPIILGGTSTHLFGGSSTHYSRRARALIIQRTAKQRTSKWMQNEHERNEFMKCSLEKMRARTHYFWGLEHPLFWGLEHSLFKRARALTIRRTLK
jgi:hypothetical protein